MVLVPDGGTRNLSDVKDEAYAYGRAKWGERPLWPAKYCRETHESAWDFVRAQWTWNEAEKAIQPFPTLDYLEEYVYDWEEGYRLGRMLVAEKCRRMVVSWAARCLELRRMGMGRCDQILIGENFASSSKHVWRLKFLYEGMQKRYPDWRLSDHNEIKHEGGRKLKQFGLSNGSLCVYGNGEADTFQGDGTAVVTMEEFGTYRYGASILAQAKIITMGSPGSVGGFVNLITNTNPNVDWQLVKKNAQRIGL